MRWGQLGVAVIAPSFKIVAYVVTCVHPPYPVLPIIFMFAGFGNGLEDGGWNAWIGNMQNANELLGFLHGAYGLGATISPCEWNLPSVLTSCSNAPLSSSIVLTLTFSHVPSVIHSDGSH